MKCHYKGARFASHNPRLLALFTSHIMSRRQSLGQLQRRSPNTLPWLRHTTIGTSRDQDDKTSCIDSITISLSFCNINQLETLT